MTSKGLPIFSLHTLNLNYWQIVFKEENLVAKKFNNSPFQIILSLAQKDLF